MSVSRHAGEEFYLIEIKNSDIQVSSDFCFFGAELPAAVQILLFDSNKKIMMQHGGDFLLLRCPMEEGEILFESNKKPQHIMGGFPAHEMLQQGRKKFYLNQIK